MIQETNTNIPIEQRIFCNRNLNTNSIKAVGFDMDYTLALYIPQTFEKLAYEETLKKLVDLAYPKDILQWEFNSNYMIRGLVIDKKQGNILKMDRHRFVKVAHHGFKELSRDERRKIYDVENVISYEEPHFALIDTIFALAEAFLFSQLVDFKEKTEHLKNKTFLDIYNDIRHCLDACHRDGSIKNKVIQNPSEYITHDPHLQIVLQILRDSGKKLFILTNSLWEYTKYVMTYLLGVNWLSQFDMVATGSQKPHFFVSKNSLYEVDPQTYLLKNLEPALLEEKTANCKHLVFQGGHVNLLHEFLSIHKGSEILYVGDHIYGDILRSKKEIGWRTMLVIEELEQEIKTLHSLDKSFHPIWGEIMKTGLQNSRFSAQVETFACLYTSKLTNLRHYSSDTNFIAARDYMPHDFDIE